MSARDVMFKIYFCLQRIIVPGLRYSHEIYEEVLKSQITLSTTWLDLGCGHQVLPEWRWGEEQNLVRVSRMVVGIDYDWTNLRKHKSIRTKVRGNITCLPFKDGSFDLVTANMVVEHVSEPDHLFSEVSRVLKRGGVFVFHTPNRAGYGTVLARIMPQRVKHVLIRLLADRGEEDVFKTFYMANNPKSIIGFSLQAGFEVRQLRLINSAAECAVVPPLALIELLWIRLLMTKTFKPFRTNIIAVLCKNADSSAIP